MVQCTSSGPDRSIRNVALNREGNIRSSLQNRAFPCILFSGYN